MTPKTHLILRLVAVTALVAAALWPKTGGASRHAHTPPAASSATTAALATLAVR